MMNASIAWASVALAIGLTIFGARGRLTPFLITVGTLSTLTIGYASLADSFRRPGPLQAYSAGFVLLASGYAYARRTGTNRATARPHLEPVDTQHVGGVLIVLAVLAVLHFSQVGLPILHSNVEIARFDFTGSGLFGLPGRDVLFAIPIGTFLAVAYASSRGATVSRPGWILSAAIILLLSTRLVMGFKSSLLEALTVLLFAATLAWKPPRLTRAAWTLAAPLVATAIFAVAVAGLYTSVAHSDTSGISYLVDRATVVGALPGYTLLDGHLSFAPIGPSALVNDILYYVPKYLNLGVSATRFPFQDIVSAAIYGTPLLAGSFIVPVTTGAFAELSWEFGVVAFPIYCVLGACYGWVESRAFRTTSAWRFVIYVTILSMFSDYLTKGNPVYTVLNWGAMLAFVGLVLGGLRIAAKGRHQAWHRRATSVVSLAPGATHD